MCIFVENKQIEIMTNEQTQQAAINQVGFEYFTNCINNGATSNEAKDEMMTKEAQIIIAERINLIINA